MYMDGLEYKYWGMVNFQDVYQSITCDFGDDCKILPPISFQVLKNSFRNLSHIVSESISDVFSKTIILNKFEG